MDYHVENNRGRRDMCVVDVTIRLRDDMPQPTHLNLTGWCGQTTPVLPPSRENFDTQGRTHHNGLGYSPPQLWWGQGQQNKHPIYYRIIV